MSERWRAAQLACRNPSIRLTPLPTGNGGTLQPFLQIRGSLIEIVLTTGPVVRVPFGFDSSTLGQILAVLEGRPC
jgi:hypothetical protein